MDDQAITPSKPHYGVATLSVGIEHRFEGHEAYEGQGFSSLLVLETARGHLVARMYDPADGRFISRDPIGFEGSKWSLYEYTGSSPMDRLDYSGEKFASCAIFLACGGTQLAACSLACTWDPIWDDPRDTWLSCVSKCHNTQLQGAGVDIHNNVCAIAAAACGIEVLGRCAIKLGPQKLPEPVMPQGPQGPAGGI